jgi:hypothetical protein
LGNFLLFSCLENDSKQPQEEGLKGDFLQDNSCQKKRMSLLNEVNIDSFKGHEKVTLPQARELKSLCLLIEVH